MFFYYILNLNLLLFFLKVRKITLKNYTAKKYKKISSSSMYRNNRVEIKRTNENKHKTNKLIV